MLLVPLLFIAAGIAGLFFPEYIIADPKSYSPFIFLLILLTGIYLLYRGHKKFSKRNND